MSSTGTVRVCRMKNCSFAKNYSFQLLHASRSAQVRNSKRFAAIPTFHGQPFGHYRAWLTEDVCMITRFASQPFVEFYEAPKRCENSFLNRLLSRKRERERERCLVRDMSSFLQRSTTKLKKFRELVYYLNKNKAFKKKRNKHFCFPIFEESTPRTNLPGREVDEIFLEMQQRFSCFFGGYFTLENIG